MSMRLYKSYMFRTKDPVIDEFRTLLQDTVGTKKLTSKHFKRIELDGGPTETCMRAWLYGETKRPQSASIEAAGRALGYKRVWVKDNGKKSE